MATKARESGFSLLEMLGAMAVASAMLIGLSYWIDMGIEDSKGQQAALYQKRFADGVAKLVNDPTWNAYIKANATTSVPVKVAMSNLTAGNFVPPGSMAQNAYGQTPCGLVYYDSTGDRIDALLTTEGGNAIPEKQLGYIAANAGDGAGFISSSTPTQARGAFGGWQITLATYTDGTAAKNCTGTPAAAGRLATQLFKEASGTLESDFLYRNQVPGRPDLNTMNTPILLSASTVQTVGDACTTNGALARDANGALVSCQLGVWKTQGSAYWQDPVASFASLPACNAASALQTRVVQTPNAAVVGNTGPRAYTCDGSVWRPLSIDDNGDITVAGTASISKLAGNLEVTAVAVENAACSPNGRIARDAVGLLLSCQSGLWKKASGSASSSILGEYDAWTSGTTTMSVNFTSNGNPVLVSGYSYAYSGGNSARWALLYLDCDGAGWNTIGFQHNSIYGASVSGFMKFNLAAGSHTCSAYVAQSHASGRGGIVVQQM